MRAFDALDFFGALTPPEYEQWLAGGATGSLAQNGGKLFMDLGCNTCHRGDGQARGPNLVGLFGRGVNLADGGLDPAAAVAAPRVRVAPGGGELWVEADYPGADELQRSDLPVKLLPPRSTSMGHAAALVVDGSGQWRAGADPRSDGSVEFA